MICNVIDHRKRRYRWKLVHAIIEASEHDNACKDSDMAPKSDAGTYVMFEERRDISVQEAIKWADAFECPVTLYLYDKDAMPLDVS